MKDHLRRLRKQGEHQKYGALLTAACAGTWTRSRTRQHYDADDTCECGETETDAHRIWGGCNQRSNDEMFEKDGKTQSKDNRRRGRSPS
eukprot:9067828-Pyramimonas_sp.AAC.1